jgi:YidC/Oxa1 family membrane protein insertase
VLAFAPLGGAVDAAYHIVSGLAAGVGATAAIVVFTVAVRLLLLPLSYAQSRSRSAVGCLPALLQAPFFLILYRSFTSTSVAGGPNHLLTESLYGVPLGTHLQGALGHGLLTGPVAVFAILFVALAVLAWLASRRMRAALTRAAATGGESPPVPRVTRLIPYGTLLAAAVLPLAAVVYLVTTNAWTALETTILSLGR